ncbi:pentapeptide repeat-containing protein [Nostoc sp.]|uniref:pentapeptide repeat-containing protein n=1 Tax=Nostoc sp. TaxID=1180 RepID=UPI003FA5B006
MLCKPGVEKCNNLTNADLGKANLTGVNLDRAKICPPVVRFAVMVKYSYPEITLEFHHTKDIKVLNFEFSHTA